MLLDRADRVAGISYAEGLRACKVVDGAAFLNALSSSDTIIYQSGEEWKRSSLSMGKVYAVISLCQVVYKVFHLFFVCCEDIVYAVEGCHIACLRS